MKKSLRAMAAALLGGTLLLSGCTSQSSVESSVAAEPVKAEKHIVFLGDSITAGYGLDDPTAQAYSVLLTEKLNARDTDADWREFNYAISGDDSSDLVRRLETGRALRLPSADTIVICIGANNLLGAYTGYLSDLVGDRDFTEMTDEEIERLQQELTEQLENDQNVQAEIEKRVDEGLERLKTDLETIYSWIRERNADADIYVMNIYNPYRGVTETLPNGTEPMDDFSQNALDRCNKILADWEAVHTNLHAVDLAAAFAAENPVPIIGADGASGDDGLYLDPHPNAHGHEIIADLIYNSMQ